MAHGFGVRGSGSRGSARGSTGSGSGSGSEKTIVEHTAINPNKAAHIGHLRNAALGDAFGRLLRFQGRAVEIQNYIDDTGVQVADVVVGFRELEHKTLADVRAIADSTRFDYYCWDLYARVTEWYAADADPAKPRLKIRTAALHDIEHGGNETADLAAFIAERIVRAHLKTMGRMNIRYDLLTWEGDILRMQFWAHAFEFLKKTGEVFLQTEGKLKGCWVMKIDDEPEAGSGKPEAESGTPDADGEEQREKVIVRSDGTVTYVGKDMALQMWKFGLLDRDFHYRVFAESPAPPLWSTSSDPATAVAPHPEFGHASMVCNVIDTRQAYLQKLLKQALAALGFQEQARRSVHYSYEMVALTHSTARELGYEEADDTGKPFVEVSGRKGLGVKADDLLDRLTGKASGEVARRNTELSGGRGAADGGDDRRGRRPLLHGQVLARQGHRLRHRRGAELRGRKRSVPAVRRGARQQHLREAEGSRRARRRRASSPRCPRPRRMPSPAAATTRTSCGAWCSRPRASTRSSIRRSARWSCRWSRSTPSRSRSSSTGSTTRSRFSRKSAPTSASGAPPRSHTIGSSSRGPSI